MAGGEGKGGRGGRGAGTRPGAAAAAAELPGARRLRVWHTTLLNTPYIPRGEQSNLPPGPPRPARAARASMEGAGGPPGAGAAPLVPRARLERAANFLMNGGGGSRGAAGQSGCPARHARRSRLPFSLSLRGGGGTSRPGVCVWRERGGVPNAGPRSLGGWGAVGNNGPCWERCARGTAAPRRAAGRGPGSCPAGRDRGGG